MINWHISTFIQDLGTLERLIVKYEIPIVSTTINELMSELERNTYSNNSIAHVISDFEFLLNQKVSGTTPDDVEEFSFIIDLNFIPDYSVKFLEKDPFFNDKVNFKNNDIDAYTFQLEIHGHSLSKEYVNYWHLDRHITGGGTSKVVHPFYHFQNGGNKLEASEFDNGEILFMGAPRIPHPPMDIFLAVHFVLTNFYNRNSFDSIDDLLTDDDYIDVISRAQNRMWKPYYGAFNSENHEDYKIEYITPLYTVHS